MSIEQPDQESHQSGKGNWPMLGKLAVFALIMFGFGWGMIPLYNAICDVTGVNVLTRRDETASAFAKSTQVDTSRTIVVEFDTNIHGLWRFKPVKRSIEVHPGELATVEYELVNTVDRTMAGQAIPSYAPKIARYLLPQTRVLLFPAADAGGQRNPAFSGGIRDRSGTAGGSHHDHAVLHVFRRRRAGR